MGWDIAKCTLDWKEPPHFKYVYSIILCVKAAVILETGHCLYE